MENPSLPSDFFPVSASPTSLSQDSLLSIPSIHKLREVLSKTSEKLSNFSSRQQVPYQDLIDKTHEISELKAKIIKLEQEKKEMIKEFQKLTEANQSLKEPILDSDISIIKITKLTNNLVSKVKDNANLRKKFLDNVGNENDLFLQIKSENFKLPLLSILKFVCDVVDYGNFTETCAGEGSIGRGYVSMADDYYHKLIEESENLAKTISNQKAKISRICDKVRENIKSTPQVEITYNRPKSSMLPSDYLQNFIPK